MTQVASFDVFDTVLTRAVGLPSTVFLLLGRRLTNMSLIQCTPEAFARARIEAELRAYKNVADGKVMLKQIYSELKTALWLTEKQCNQLINLELELENELIRMVPGARNRIWKSRANGQRVVFMSDMYLTSNFIQKQLACHGLWVDSDKCYVSCEYGKSKVTGDLFQELVQSEAVPPKLVSHCGNNMKYDVRMAKAQGLQVEPFLEGNLNGYEQILESYAWATEGLTSVMAGASRLARLAVPVSSPEQQALCNVSAGVLAPTLVGFVMWLLQNMQQRGLQRLYFVSRDGQVLIEIARRLADKLKVSCELRYIYGSRQSWNFPAVTNIAAEQLSWIWDFTDFLSIRTLLARVRVAPEEIKKDLTALGFKDKDWDRNLTVSERSDLPEVLLQSSELHELVIRRASEERAIIIKYFEQEGLLDSIRWGVVDIGWHGNLHGALCKLLSMIGVNPPIAFYFGLHPSSPEEYLALREAYLFNSFSGFYNKDIFMDLVKMLEMFCAADHGTVTGFIQGTKGIQPVLKECYNQPVLNWGLPLVRETLYCFLENLVLDPTILNLKADVRQAIVHILRSFWSHPSSVEVMAWGAFPWEDGLGEETYRNTLTKGYGWKHVVRALWTGKIKAHHRGSWHQGCFALTPWTVKISLQTAIQLWSALHLFKYTAWRLTPPHVRHIIKRLLKRV